MGAVFIEMAKQVPALLCLAFIVAAYIRSQKDRDNIFMTFISHQRDEFLRHETERDDRMERIVKDHAAQQGRSDAIMQENSRIIEQNAQLLAEVKGVLSTVVAKRTT